MFEFIYQKLKTMTYKIMKLLESRRKRMVLILLISFGILLMGIFSFNVSDNRTTHPGLKNNENVMRKSSQPDSSLTLKSNFINSTLPHTIETPHLLLSNKFLLPISPKTKTSSTSITTTDSESRLPTLTRHLNAALENAQQVEYTIILWDAPFGNPVPQAVNSPDCGKCHITYDRSKSHDEATKAIVFHFNELKTSNWPDGRRGDQLYAWWTMESSSNLQRIRTLVQFDGVFNLTMSHRRDSDIYTPYGIAPDIWKKLQNSKSGNPSRDIDDLVARKTKLAIWIVSNCASTIGARKRMAYVNQLIVAGFDLHRRGKCFPKNGVVSSMQIVKQYKFYLAFENSIYCKDYITEKLFDNGLSMGAVPVVWGAPKSDYEAVVPPGSCIYVEDFKSPEQLIKYLNYLDDNTTAYKQYFNWRTMKIEDMPQYNRTKGFCNLCRILHGINVDNIYKPLDKTIPMFSYPDHPRIVPSLRGWFYGMENPECLSLS